MRAPLAPAGLALALAGLALAGMSAAQDAVRLGQLSTEEHGVAGTVYALSDRLVEVRGFRYDGRGPDAFFWVDKGARATVRGALVPARPSCGGGKLGKGDGEDLVLELPVGLNEVGYLSVWCRAVGASFGGLAIVQRLVAGLKITAAAEFECDGGSSGGGNGGGATGEEPFVVADGWNCEVLLEDEMQVRWKVSGGDISVEMVGRITDEQYMAFGPSGSDTKTAMVGGDPAVALRGVGGEYVALDCYMTSQGACDGDGNGVCPDTAASAADDHLSAVEGERQGDLVRVQYTRPMAAVDEDHDRAFKEKGDTYVTWAIGPVSVLGSGDQLPAYHAGKTIPAGKNVAFDFGRRTEAKSCSPLLTKAAAAEVDVPPIDRPVLPLEEGQEVFARIGPSGGNRGLSAISGRVGWGIAWYMQQGSEGVPVLAATLGVERGKTYKFRVQGGDNPEARAAYHPLYITSSKDGGGQDGAKETIFAEAVSGKLCEFSEGKDSGAAVSYGDYVGSLDTSCVDDAEVSRGAGTLEWTVAADTPDIVYYQCRAHAFLGWKIRVFDKGTMTAAALEAINVEQSARAGEETCKVTFKGVERSFHACRKGLSGAVDVYWTIEGDRITTLFSAEAEDGGYVSWGWGQKMMTVGDGSGAAVVAYADPNSGEAIIKDYCMTAKTSEGVQPKTPTVISGEEAEVSSGRVKGLYTRPLSEKVVNGPSDAIWAVGPKVSSATALGQHSLRDGGTFDLSATTAGAGESHAIALEKFWKWHGWLMGIAWVVLAPIAIMAMRFGKRWNPFAFRVHQLLLMLVFLVTLGAFILAVVKGDRRDKKHLAVGCVVLALAVMQLLLAIFRPNKQSGKREVFYLLHSNGGRLCWLLALINVFIGLDIADASTSLKVVTGVVTGVFAVTFALLTLMGQKFPSKEAYIRRDDESADAP